MDNDPFEFQDWKEMYREEMEDSVTRCKALYDLVADDGTKTEHVEYFTAHSVEDIERHAAVICAKHGLSVVLISLTQYAPNYFNDRTWYVVPNADQP